MRFFLVPLLLAGCALSPDNYRRPLILKKERAEYVMNYGWNVRPRLRTAFEEGRVESGMTYEMVSILYGDPSLVLRSRGPSLLYDSVLMYNANDTHTIGSVSFLGDTAVKATGQFLLPCRF